MLEVSWCTRDYKCLSLALGASRLELGFTTHQGAWKVCPGDREVRLSTIRRKRAGKYVQCIVVNGSICRVPGRETSAVARKVCARYQGERVRWPRRVRGRDQPCPVHRYSGSGLAMRSDSPGRIRAAPDIGDEFAAEAKYVRSIGIPNDRGGGCPSAASFAGRCMRGMVARDHHGTIRIGTAC